MEPVALCPDQREALVKRLQERKLIEPDYPILLAIVAQEAEEKEGESEQPDEPSEPEGEQAKQPDEPEKKKKKRKGHGRLGEKDYPGARDVKCPPGDYQAGSQCPHCNKGHLNHNKVKKLIVLMATAPVEAVRYWIDQLRCNWCGQTVEELPEEVRRGKHHPSANAAVVLMKYALGVPGKRLETWQKYLGVPLPDATQYDMISKLKDSLEPIHGALEELLARSDIFQLDDTSMPVLSFIEENKSRGEGERYGMHATGILGAHDQHPICLYYIGRNHAGENLDELLNKRPEHLPAPVQMGDASANNTCHGHDTIKANCQAHAVRRFKDNRELFPHVANCILSSMAKIFVNDRKTKEMDADQRLTYHQKHSKPVMDLLHLYLRGLLEEKVVEPNSQLGGSINYMLKYWAGFTCFLHVPGAPIDNNITERALKLVIRLRKNSSFFKTARSAAFGGVILGILATLTANGVNPMDYLIAVQMNESDVQQQPQRWLPWNYLERMRQLNAA